MSLSCTLLLIAGSFGVAETETWTQFDNYAQAYEAAKRTKQPMLVILNPGGNSETKAISVADVRRTEWRRTVLTNFVVAVIDTNTESGKRVHKAFGNDPLPHVSVIDKNQKYQLFNTSEKLYGQLWNQILQRYRGGVQPTVPRPVQSFCPT